MFVRTQSRTVATQLKHEFETVPNYAFKMYSLLMISVDGKLCINLVAFNCSPSLPLFLSPFLPPSLSLSPSLPLSLPLFLSLPLSLSPSLRLYSIFSCLSHSFILSVASFFRLFYFSFHFLPKRRVQIPDIQ